MSHSDRSVKSRMEDLEKQEEQIPAGMTPTAWSSLLLKSIGPPIHQPDGTWRARTAADPPASSPNATGSPNRKPTPGPLTLDQRRRNVAYLMAEFHALQESEWRSSSASRSTVTTSERHNSTSSNSREDRSDSSPAGNAAHQQRDARAEAHMSLSPLSKRQNLPIRTLTSSSPPQQLKQRRQTAPAPTPPRLLRSQTDTTATVATTTTFHLGTHHPFLPQGKIHRTPVPPFDRRSRRRGTGVVQDEISERAPAEP